MRACGQLAIVGIAKDHRHSSIGQGLVASAAGVCLTGNAFVKHRLARPVDAAVGHHDRRPRPLRTSVAADGGAASTDAMRHTIEHGGGPKHHALPADHVAREANLVATLGVGCGGSGPLKCLLLTVPRLHKRIHGGTREGLTGANINKVPRQLAVPEVASPLWPVASLSLDRRGLRRVGHQGQPADPHKAAADHVVAVGEGFVGRGQHPVAARGQVAGNGNVVAPTSEIGSGGNIGCKGFDRFGGEDLPAVVRLQPLPLRPARFQPFLPVSGHNPQRNPCEIEVVGPNDRPWLSPGPLGRELQ